MITAVNFAGLKMYAFNGRYCSSHDSEQISTSMVFIEFSFHLKSVCVKHNAQNCFDNAWLINTSPAMGLLYLNLSSLVN